MSQLTKDELEQYLTRKSEGLLQRLNGVALMVKTSVTSPDRVFRKCFGYYGQWLEDDAFEKLSEAIFYEMPRDVVWKAYDTYGLPLEEIAAWGLDRSLVINLDTFVEDYLRSITKSRQRL